MKKLRIVFFMLMLFCSIQYVMAEELTNVKASFKHEFDLTNSYEDLYMEITSDNYGENEYRVLFTKNNTNIPNAYNNPDELEYLSIENNIGKILNLEYIAQYGNVYITLYEYDGNNFNKASDTILVNRPQLLSYTNRIIPQFYSDNSMDIKIKDIFSENSTVKFKLGEVNDITLLNKLNGTNNSAYSELMSYAKKDTNSIINGSVLITSTKQGDELGSYPNKWDVTKVAKDKYYYGYFAIDNENGKYYELEDVQLYRLEEGSLFATNYKSDTLPSSEIDASQTTDATSEEKVNNPDTGVSFPVVTIIIIMTGSIVALVFTHKKTVFKQI